jgi:hypothetical protein
MSISAASRISALDRVAKSYYKGCMTHEQLAEMDQRIAALETEIAALSPRSRARRELERNRERLIMTVQRWTMSASTTEVF